MTIKKTLKKTSMLIVALMLFAMIFTLAKMAVHADDTIAKRPCPKKISIVLTKKNMNTFDLDSAYKVKLKKCKSNKKSVASVIKDNAGNYSIKAKKAGKAKITIYGKKKGSEKYKKYQTTVKVYKYKNAFKSLKVGDKEYQSHFKANQEYQSKKGLSGKLNIKAAKGWKLVGIGYMDEDTDKYGDYKNGDTVNINNGMISISMTHKASRNMLVFDIAIGD